MSVYNNTQKKIELTKERFFVDGWLRSTAFHGWLSKTKRTLEPDAYSNSG